MSCGVTTTNPCFADLVRIAPLLKVMFVGEEGVGVVMPSLGAKEEEEGWGAPKRVLMGSRHRPVEEASTSSKWSSDRVLQVMKASKQTNKQACVIV